MKKLFTWERMKKELRFYKWPLMIQCGLLIVSLFLLVTGLWSALPSTFSSWIFTLSCLVFLPFFYADWRCRRQETHNQRREMEAKHDAEETAMFGKPLREIEL